jgi:hypothetical protein
MLACASRGMTCTTPRAAEQRVFRQARARRDWISKGLQVQVSGSDVLAAAAGELPLGVIEPEQLPAVAATALDSGLESPALISLAGLSDENTREARSLFSRALDELGVQMPSPREAVIDLTRKIASEIVDGSLAPYAGAKRVWELATRVPSSKCPSFIRLCMPRTSGRRGPRTVASSSRALSVKPGSWPVGNRCSSQLQLTGCLAR